MESIWEKFAKMYREKSQIALLTWAYLIISIAVVLVAGLIALIDQSVGVAILTVPLIAGAAMCANVMVWSVIRLILDAYDAKEKAKQRAAKGVKTTKK